MGSGLKKEYRTLPGFPAGSLPDPSSGAKSGRVSVLSAAVHAFLSSAYRFDSIVVTVPERGEADAARVLAEDPRIAPLITRNNTRLSFISGGSTRQESVFRALESLSGDEAPGAVLVHDGARPWISCDLIDAVQRTTEERGAAVPGIAAVDTQKEIDEEGRIIRHLERRFIAAVQTPQGFRFSPLLEAHRKAAGDGRTYTDDAEIWGRYEGDVFVCPGDRENRKITFPEDLA